MADSTTWLLAGVGIGIAIGIGVAAVRRDRRQDAQPEGVTAVEFRRDEHDRIIGFEKTAVGAGVGAIPDGR